MLLTYVEKTSYFLVAPPCHIIAYKNVDKINYIKNMMFQKCSNVHWFILRGFNFIKIVYELSDNPAYCFIFHVKFVSIVLSILDFLHQSTNFLIICCMWLQCLEHECWWSLQQIFLLKSCVFYDPTASFSPGSGTVLKFSVRVARSLSRWPCSAMFVLRCCTASTSSFSMACFMLSLACSRWHSVPPVLWFACEVVSARLPELR